MRYSAEAANEYQPRPKLHHRTVWRAGLQGNRVPPIQSCVCGPLAYPQHSQWQQRRASIEAYLDMPLMANL